MKKNNSLIFSSFLYIFGNILVSGLSFITTPIFTRLLTPEEYGIATVFLTWINLFTTFIGLQTMSTIPVAKMKFEKKEFNEYLSSILFLSTLSFIFIMIICLILKNKISIALKLPNFLIYILLIQSFFNYALEFYNNYLIQSKKASKSFILSVCYSFCTVLLSVLLVSNMSNQRYLGKIFGNAIVTFIIGVISYCIIMFKGKKIFSKKYWKYCLPLSIPVIFHILAGLILSQSDRVMIQQLSGNTEAGLYSFAYSIATVVSMFTTATNNAWVPWYYENTKFKKINCLKIISKKYILLFSFGTCIIMLIIPEIIRVLSPEEYWSVGPIIVLIIFGIYFSFLCNFAVNYEFYSQNTRWIAVGSICAAAVNVGLNLLLIPKFGGMGAAVATLISYFALFVFHNIIAARLGGFNISKRLYLYGIGIVSVGFIVINLTYDFPILRWIIILLLGFGLIYFNRKVIKEQLKRYLKKDKTQ